MDNSLYDMIFKRKSFHLFRNTGRETLTDEEISKIYDKYKTLIPLNPEIKTAIRIVKGEETSCKRDQEYCILFYSEEKEGYLRNIGYIGEQLDLYLASQNIGTLWFGIGKTEESQYNGMEFVIMIAIKKVDDASRFRKNMFRSKRKPIEQIWEGEEIPGVSDIIRFAPSACNTQPWFVKHANDKLYVYRYKDAGKRSIMPKDKVSYYNQIDIGIFLCFMDLCFEYNGINYDKLLVPDKDKENELILNTTYILK